jgi:hypothetical protein|tara:strand:+ start:774 stop:1298 length:525 start_codon:yes stop_codon:yes gene_type:complete
MHKVIDNFLNVKDYNNIYNFLKSEDTPWYFKNDDVTQEKNVISLNKNGFFNFCFYNNYSPSHQSFYTLIPPLIEKLNAQAIIQIRANLVFRDKDSIESAYHNDYLYKDSFTAIYYLTSCNAKTVLKIDDREIPIDSVENRMLLFPCKILHKVIYQTDLHKRYLLNINFFGEPWQ